jgi:hypothetical protein
MSSVDAACVHECGGPTHDERRRAIKSHEWRLSGAARVCVGVPTLWKDQVHVVCRCSMRAQPKLCGVEWSCRKATGSIPHSAREPSPVHPALDTSAPKPRD